MKLGLLGANLQLNLVNKDLEIFGLSSDSRKIQPGYLFAATNLGSLNCADFIPNAIANGAVAILTTDTSLVEQYPCVVFLKSDCPNKDLAQMAAKFYPAQPENICAITGTNGKTSIADFIRQIIFAMGENAASLGTLGIIKNNFEPIVGANTTPETVTIHQELSDLAHDGFNYLAMEASSHGICEYRIGGIKIKVAGFTNLTRDHLDYHKTMENYFQAKKMLFTELLEPNGLAVLNADIEVYPALKQACLDSGRRVMSYGHHGDDIKLLSSYPLNNGQNLRIHFKGIEQEIFVPLAGEFQAMNVLCAIGMASELTQRFDEVLKHISSIKGAKGRLELVKETKSGATIYVDYAHTPDALENVIQAMRSHTTGKLHVLFGCGGDRDNGKRPIMGKIAADLADEVYVSDDNPRTENPTEIRRQIMVACPNAHNIGGRKEAIAFAISQLNKGDVLIVAGKGHETGQYIMGKVYPFSDQEVILNTPES